MSTGMAFAGDELILQEFLEDWATEIRSRLELQKLKPQDWLLLQTSLIATIRALAASAVWVDLDDYEGDLGKLITEAAGDLASWLQTH